MKGAEYVPKLLEGALSSRPDLTPLRPTQMTDEEWLVQLSKLRKERDLWQSMHRNQCGVNEPLHQLAADQRELIEGLRVQVNQFERLLGLIPCTGDFDRACAWVTSVTGAGARPPQSGNESHCVAEVLGVHHLTLWCSNCNEKVCEGEAAPGQSIQQWGVDHELAWENHCAGARPRGEKTGGTPKRECNPYAVEKDGVTTLRCSSCDYVVSSLKALEPGETNLKSAQALHGFWKVTWQQHVNAVRSGTGGTSAPAYPNGRFASKEKGGV